MPSWIKILKQISWGLHQTLTAFRSRSEDTKLTKCEALFDARVNTVVCILSTVASSCAFVYRNAGKVYIKVVTVTSGRTRHRNSWPSRDEYHCVDIFEHFSLNTPNLSFNSLFLRNENFDYKFQCPKYKMPFDKEWWTRIIRDEIQSYVEKYGVFNTSW